VNCYILFHFTRVQELNVRDHHARENICCWLLNEVDENFLAVLYGPTSHYLCCDDGVASRIAEYRKSPSTIVNYTINAICDDLRSLSHEKRQIEKILDAGRRREDMRNEDSRQYAKRRRDNTRDRGEMIREAKTLDNTRNGDETIRETETKRYAKREL